MTGFADRHLHAEAESAAWDEAQREQPRFANTFCSQCGQEFGPGDHGFSHCRNHSQKFLAMENQAARLHSALSELSALVRGECPALLDETRGGNSRLDMDIAAALTPNVKAKRATAAGCQARGADDKHDSLAGLVPCRWRSA